MLHGFDVLDYMTSEELTKLLEGLENWTRTDKEIERIAVAILAHRDALPRDYYAASNDQLFDKLKRDAASEYDKIAGEAATVTNLSAAQLAAIYDHVESDVLTNSPLPWWLADFAANCTGANPYTIRTI